MPSTTVQDVKNEVTQLFEQVRQTALRMPASREWQHAGATATEAQSVVLSWIDEGEWLKVSATLADFARAMLNMTTQHLPPAPAKLDER